MRLVYKTCSGVPKSGFQGTPLRISQGSSRFIFHIAVCNYYILVQGFRVTCLITGQYNIKGYGTITDVI